MVQGNAICPDRVLQCRNLQRAGAQPQARSGRAAGAANAGGPTWGRLSAEAERRELWMGRMTDHKSTNLLELTAEIVVAYLRLNSVAPSQIGPLISRTYSALFQVGSASSEQAKPVAQVPAVPIRKSVTRDAIICLEDGVPFKSLKRHLRTKYGLSPEQYREKWDLPDDYPMVSPSYSAKRSSLALRHGLGRKP